MKTGHIMKYVNSIYALCDEIDRFGITIFARTEDTPTVKDALQQELIQFLLHIAIGNGVLTTEKIAFLDSVTDSLCQSDEWWAAFSTHCIELHPSKTGVLLAFSVFDLVCSKEAGVQTTSSCDKLIFLFDFLGELMVSLDEDPRVKANYTHYMTEMKAIIESYAFHHK